MGGVAKGVGKVLGGTLGGPIVSGVFGLGGALLESRQAGRATKASERATEAALAFEREKEASRKASFDAAMVDYNKRLAANDALKAALLQRLGFSMPISTPPIASTPGVPRSLPSIPAGPVRAPMALPPGATPPVATRLGGRTLGELIQPGPGELSAWNDWSNHGLA